MRAPDHDHRELPKAGATEDLFSAALFDLDGTLTDSEALLYDAWTELVARAGADFSTFEYRRIIGRPDIECSRIVSEHFGLGKDPSGWYEEYREILAGMMGRLGVRRGAHDLLARLERRGTPMAVVTSAYAAHAERSLQACGLDRYFRVAVTADTPGLAARKPDPAPYLLGARLLGVDPASCIVFEDSPSGVRAGVAAGCFVFGCPHPHSPAEGLSEAHVILPELADFRSEMVRRPRT